MEAKTAWRYLDNTLLIDLPNIGRRNIEPGCNSKEKVTQTFREHLILPVVYPTKHVIPNSPEEPYESEINPHTKPLNIPLQDIFGGDEIVYDCWPTAKSVESTIVKSPVEIDNEKQMLRQHQFSVHNPSEINRVNVDNMEAKTSWQYLDNTLLIDIPNTGKAKIELGCYSKEKIIQPLREQLISQVIYSTKNMIPNSPEEPDEMEVVPYSEPLNIPLEDVSEIKNPTKRTKSIQYVESKRSHRSSTIETLDPLYDIRPNYHKIIQQPATNPVYSDNQMNHGLNNINSMKFENMMRIPPPANNVYFPLDRFIMNGQSIQQKQLNEMPQQQPLPYHISYNQNITPYQFMGEPDKLFVQQYQNPVQQQPPPSNELLNSCFPIKNDQPWVPQQHLLNNIPSHFEKDRRHGYITEDNSREHNRNVSFWDKIKHNNQQYNQRKSDYQVNGHPVINRRVNRRFCKHFVKHGFCRNISCTYSH